MKITEAQLRRIIKEEKNKLLSEQLDSSIVANRLLDETMSFLENKLYSKYPEAEVEEFAVEAMEIMGRIEELLVRLIDGGYRENY